MTEEEIIKQLNGVSGFFAFVSIVGCAAFVSIYSRTTWKETALGRNVMALMGTIAIMLSIAVLRLWFPDSLLIRTWIWTIGLIFISYLVWRRVWILAEVQAEQDRTNRKAYRDGDDSPEEPAQDHARGENNDRRAA